jgi:hypothetical protein
MGFLIVWVRALVRLARSADAAALRNVGGVGRTIGCARSIRAVPERHRDAGMGALDASSQRRFWACAASRPLAPCAQLPGLCLNLNRSPCARTNAPYSKSDVAHMMWLSLSWLAFCVFALFLRTPARGGVGSGFHFAFYFVLCYRYYTKKCISEKN